MHRGDHHIYHPSMTNLDDTFLHAKNLWKKVYKRVFSQDNSLTERKQKDPVKNPQYREHHHESPETPEVGSLQDEFGEFMDRTGFGDVRRNQFYCLAYTQHGTTA